MRMRDNRLNVRGPSRNKTKSSYLFFVWTIHF